MDRARWAVHHWRTRSTARRRAPAADGSATALSKRIPSELGGRVLTMAISLWRRRLCGLFSTAWIAGGGGERTQLSPKIVTTPPSSGGLPPEAGFAAVNWFAAGNSRLNCARCRLQLDYGATLRLVRRRALLTRSARLHVRCH
ncbi:hypothetical protein Q1695_001911 [Nippostrongylus brasiliensis]|nr:hypothetical protein Q1695_001911 [Nippostrongylus brasiliensis]